MNILDYLARPAASFRPQTMEDVFALRLAHKLGNEAKASDYVELLSEYRREQLLAAYRRAAESPPRPSAMADVFHRALTTGNFPQYPSTGGRLAAVKVERRSIAVTVFDGEHLDYHEVRHLTSTERRARTSAIGFFNWIVANCHVESVAFESIHCGPKNRRMVLTAAIRETCRENGLPVWEVSKPDLLRSFGHPAPRSRKELREILCSVWPILNDHKKNEQILDAAALGIHVQIERLFLH